MIAVPTAAALWFLFVVFSFQHYYGEAEPKVSAIYAIKTQLHSLHDNKEQWPASLNEILKQIPEYERAKIKDYPMKWQPESDPIFVMKVNKKYGFILDSSLNFQWLWEAEQVNQHFPSN